MVTTRITRARAAAAAAGDDAPSPKRPKYAEDSDADEEFEEQLQVSYDDGGNDESVSRGGIECDDIASSSVTSLRLGKFSSSMGS